MQQHLVRSAAEDLLERRDHFRTQLSCLLELVALDPDDASLTHEITEAVTQFETLRFRLLGFVEKKIGEEVRHAAIVLNATGDTYGILSRLKDTPASDLTIEALLVSKFRDGAYLITGSTSHEYLFSPPENAPLYFSASTKVAELTKIHAKRLAEMVDQRDAKVCSFVELPEVITSLRKYYEKILEYLHSDTPLFDKSVLARRSYSPAFLGAVLRHLEKELTLKRQ